MDPADDDVLRRPPRAAGGADAGPRASGAASSRPACSKPAVTLGVFVWALRRSDLAEARNLAFSTLVFGELFRAFAARSPTKLFWEVGVFTNLRLVGVVVVSALHSDRHPPDSGGWRGCFTFRTCRSETRVVPFLLALIPVTVLELRKLVRRPA